jgi:hypothetical protein
MNYKLTVGMNGKTRAVYPFVNGKWVSVRTPLHMMTSIETGYMPVYVPVRIQNRI